MSLSNLDWKRFTIKHLLHGPKTETQQRGCSANLIVCRNGLHTDSHKQMQNYNTLEASIRNQRLKRL